MSLDVICPHCLRSVAADAQKCPTCGTEFHVRNSDDDPPAHGRRKEKRARADDYGDDYDDDLPVARERSIKTDQRPGKVQAISIMILIGGIYALTHFLGLVGASTGVACLWPGLYYAIVLGIMAIVKGSQLLGRDAARTAPPKGIAIMMIINIINCDVVNCVLGILVLVFCSDADVESFFRG
jgi:hypothetical protein